LSAAPRLCHNGTVDATLPAQAPAGVPEGLPFWLLWFLLCVILLLIAFIFLRDKDLRRRISLFLSGARRHMTRLRIQVRLKKQKDKKAALWRELGRIAWTEDVRASCIEEECRKLAVLDGEIGRHQKTWHDVYSRIEVLGREHDAALKRYRALVAEQEEARSPHQEEMILLANRKKEILDALETSLRGAEAAETQVKAAEKDIRQAEVNPKLEGPARTARLDKGRDKAASLVAQVRAFREKIPLLQDERCRLERRLEEVEARVRVFNAAIQRIEDQYRERLRAHEKEIREWQRAKERVQDKIVDIKRLMEPLFESAGRVLDEVRLDQKDLDVAYFEIDGVNRTIAELEARLEHLK
jgi:chromosome segregation ATPase